MKKLILISALVGLSCMARAEGREEQVASYGEKVPYGVEAIRYPDFAIRFVEANESIPCTKCLPDGELKSEYVFDVLDKDSGAEICRFTFVMAGLYFQPVFSVRGKMYVVEMSTSVDSRKEYGVRIRLEGAARELPPFDLICILDEAEVKRSNPSLYDTLWIKKEKWPNQALLPTPTSVTDRAAHAPRQP